MQTTKTIGIVKVTLAVLFLLAGTSFFVPTAFADEDGGWSATEDSGGWTSTPDSGGWIATPVDAGWIATPVDSGWTAIPDTGWTATPVDAGWTATPVDTGWTATPDTGWTATPDYSPDYISYEYGIYDGGSSYSGGTYYPSTMYGSRTYYPTTYYPTTHAPVTHTTPTTNNYCVNNSCNTTITNNPPTQTQVLYSPVYTPTYVQPYVQSYTQPYVALNQYVPNGNPYVTLSSVPYTGLELGPYGIVIYWSLLILFSLFAAYMLIIVRVQNKFLRWLNAFLFGKGEVAAAASAPAEQIPAMQYKPAASVQVDYTDTFVLSQIRRANA